MVDKGKQVAIEYTVFLEDGAQVESNVGKEPLSFRCGEQTVLPALEEALHGMQIGDKKRITLSPEDAYGLRIPEAVREVDADSVPEEYRVEGAVLIVPDEQGEVLIRVSEVNGDTITLDFNHPLAGHTLTIEVTLLEAA